MLAKARQAVHASWQRLRGGELSAARGAASVAVGLFVGVLPLYGAHGGLCAVICFPLRLDLLVAFAASNISNPLLAPFLILTEVEIGSLLLSGRHLPLEIETIRAHGVGNFFLEALVGGLVVACVVAPIGAALCYWSLERWRKRAGGAGDQSASSGPLP